MDTMSCDEDPGTEGAMPWFVRRGAGVLQSEGQSTHYTCYTPNPSCTAVTPPVSPYPDPAHLEGHWDAMQDASITRDTDGTIISWSDLSGAGFDLTSDSVGTRPSYSSTGINGKPAVYFNNVANQHLISAHMHPTHGLQPFSWFVVVKPKALWFARNIFSTNEPPYSEYNRGPSANQWNSIAIGSGGVHGYDSPSDRALEGQFATENVYVVMGNALNRNCGCQFYGYISEALAYTSALPDADAQTAIQHLLYKWKEA